jgi:hypothetical protein
MLYSVQYIAVQDRESSVEIIELCMGLGTTVYSDIGLSYQPVRLHRPAGRYDIPMPNRFLLPSPHRLF